MENVKKKITNAELLSFIKENVATKTELEKLSTKEEVKAIHDKLIEIEGKMLTKKEFEDFKTEEHQPLKLTVEKFATRVKKFVDEDYPASLKRISRVDYRTKKLLGQKLDGVDAEFEEQYQGEAELRQTEAEG